MIMMSNSEIGTWKRCPRKWFVTYYLGFQPAGEPATGNRILGTRIHAALEGLYGYQLDPLMVLDMLYSLEIGARPEYADDLRTEHELARAMVEGYLQWAAETGEDADYQIIATEQDLQVPLPGVAAVMLRVRMDQVFLQKSTGTLMFRDWKSSGNFEKHEILEMDPQMRFYAMVQRLASAQVPDAPKVMGGRLTTLRRVKRTSRSTPPYYQSDNFRFNDEMLASTYWGTVQVANEIMAARAALDAHYGKSSTEVLNQLQRKMLRPVPILGNCDWSCPLSGGLCTMMDDGSDWTGHLYESEHWKQADPYAYYSDDPLRAIREAITTQAQGDA
jgi:RecB family exonuclease